MSMVYVLIKHIHKPCCMAFELDRDLKENLSIDKISTAIHTRLNRNLYCPEVKNPSIQFMERIFVARAMGVVGRDRSRVSKAYTNKNWEIVYVGTGLKAVYQSMELFVRQHEQVLVINKLNQHDDLLNKLIPTRSFS